MRFLDRCEAQLDALYSFAIVKGNAIACMGYYQPMEPQQLKMTHSVSKSINSMAIGIALGDGKINLDDRLVDFFPEELPENHDERMTRITIRDMLRMASSSVATSAAFSSVSDSWRRFYLSSIPTSQPGEHFSYDTGAAYMLSCIVTKVMGKNALAVMQERVFSYMGIDSTDWLEDPDGNNTGGWGFYIKADDMIKLGRLILNYGSWDGRQLIPEWYMRQATAKQIDTYANPGTGWGYGYGYQFWRFPENTFGYFGAFGQLLVCSPEKDMYVVTTGGCTREENRRLLTLITETIFAESLNGPIAPDNEAYDALQKRLRQLKLPTAAGEAHNSNEARYFGRTYAFDREDSDISRLTISRKDEETICLEMVFRGRQIQFEAGYQAWLTKEGVQLDTNLHTLHSFTYGWFSPDVLQIKQYMCNTTYYRIWRLAFSESNVQVTISQNIAIGKGQFQTMLGSVQ